MSPIHTAGTRDLFLSGAAVVAAALAEAAVADAWDEPSVLEDQQVGGLAGHLARGGVWVVADYLDDGAPDGPVDFDGAAAYFASLTSSASPADHEAIRRRGAAVAAAGRDDLLRTLRERLDSLGPRLRSLDAGHLVTVAGGHVMRLEDYLETRIVEQVVHLDDLARSVDHEPWPLPTEAGVLAIGIGIDLARRRAGPSALVRALYRRGHAEPVLPVL